jgi:hypothetical protein
MSVFENCNSSVMISTQVVNNNILVNSVPILFDISTRKCRPWVNPLKFTWPSQVLKLARHRLWSRRCWYCAAVAVDINILVQHADATFSTMLFRNTGINLPEPKMVSWILSLFHQETHTLLWNADAGTHLPDHTMLPHSTMKHKHDTPKC